MRGDMIHLRENFKIGRFLHLESEIQDSSNFEFPRSQVRKRFMSQARMGEWMFT